MTAQAALHKSDEGIRPFDLQRDLRPLADLIELAFQPELDETGNQIVQEMRRVARAGPLLWLLGAFGAIAPALMGGYVWIAGGQLVGNVSFSLESGQHGLWSIHNVAVHPDFRGRGIALQLMEAALQEARKKGAHWIVLEVNADNVPAQQMYRELGFEVYDRVDELRLSASAWPGRAAPPLVALRKRRPNDWRGLYDLCKAAIPARVQKIKPVLPAHYRLPVERRLQSWLDFLTSGRKGSDWVLEEDGKIAAWLQVMGQYARAEHRLHITVHPDNRGTIEPQLLAAGLYHLSRFAVRPILSTISVSHPEARQAWHAAGFCTVRLLDQMVLDPRKDRGKGA